MCLYTREKRKIATEDILCYKVLLHDMSGGYYVSPYARTYKWDINSGKVVAAKGKISCEPLREFDAVGNPGPYITSEKTRTVNEGCFHTFKSFSDAVRFTKYDSPLAKWDTDYEMEIFECVIPKGTVYYHGMFKPYVGLDIDYLFEHGSESYASKKLILKSVRKVSDFEFNKIVLPPIHILDMPDMVI